MQQMLIVPDGNGSRDTVFVAFIMRDDFSLSTRHRAYCETGESRQYLKRRERTHISSVMDWSFTGLCPAIPVVVMPDEQFGRSHTPSFECVGDVRDTHVEWADECIGNDLHRAGAWVRSFRDKIMVSLPLP